MLKYLLILLLSILATVFTGCEENSNYQQSDDGLICVGNAPPRLIETVHPIEEMQENNEQEVVFELPLGLRDDKCIVTSSGIVIDSVFMTELTNIYKHLYDTSDYQRFLAEISVFMENYPDMLWPEIDYNSGQRISRFAENYRNGIKDSFIILGGAEKAVNSIYFSLYDYDGEGEEYTYRTVHITQEDRIIQSRVAVLNHIEETKLTHIFGIYNNGYNNGQIAFPKYGWQPIKVAAIAVEVSIEKARELLFPLVKEKTEWRYDGDIWLKHDSHWDDEYSYGFMVYKDNPETSKHPRDMGVFTVAKDLSWFAEVDLAHGYLDIQMEPAPPPMPE